MTIGTDSSIQMAQMLQSMQNLAQVSQVQNITQTGSELPLDDIAQEVSSYAMDLVSYNVEGKLEQMETASTLAIVDMYV